MKIMVDWWLGAGVLGQLDFWSEGHCDPGNWVVYIIGRSEAHLHIRTEYPR